jgi:hypothetical protein
MIKSLRQLYSPALLTPFLVLLGVLVAPQHAWAQG